MVVYRLVVLDYCHTSIFKTIQRLDMWLSQLVNKNQEVKGKVIKTKLEM